jgi:alpha-galactosidase
MNCRASLVLCFSTALVAGSRYDAASKTWSLRSGPAEYRLRQDQGAVRLKYFGPSGLAAWRMGAQRRGGPLPSYDISGRVDGQPVQPEDLELVSHEQPTINPAVEGVRLCYRHKRLPLEIEALYTAWGETGTFTKQLKLTNTGSKPLRVESLPELAWRLPPGSYELNYLWGGWGQEKQLSTEKLGAGRRSFTSARGHSTSLYSPWFALKNTSLGVIYTAQFAYSGNWQMHFEQQPGTAFTYLRETDMQASLGTQNDFEGPLMLAGNSSRTLPFVAFTVSSGSLDEAANQLHRCQRKFVFPRTPTNDPLLVQFNSWYPFPGKMTVGEMKRCAEIAAELGTQVFVLDAGWYNRKNWSSELGDYQADPVAYPKGIEELSTYVRSND